MMRAIGLAAIACALATGSIVDVYAPAAAGTNSAGYEAREAGRRCMETAIESREIVGRHATKFLFTSGDATVVPQLIGETEMPAQSVEACYVGEVRRPSGIAFRPLRFGTGIYSGSFLAAWYTAAESRAMDARIHECVQRLGKRAYFNTATHQCDVL